MKKLVLCLAVALLASATALQAQYKPCNIGTRFAIGPDLTPPAGAFRFEAAGGRVLMSERADTVSSAAKWVICDLPAKTASYIGSDGLARPVECNQPYIPIGWNIPGIPTTPGAPSPLSGFGGSGGNTQVQTLNFVLPPGFGQAPGGLTAAEVQALLATMLAASNRGNGGERQPDSGGSGDGPFAFLRSGKFWGGVAVGTVLGAVACNKGWVCDDPPAAPTGSPPTVGTGQGTTECIPKGYPNNCPGGGGGAPGVGFTGASRGVSIPTSTILQFIGKIGGQ